jgi:hypothetical protein
VSWRFPQDVQISRASELSLLEMTGDVIAGHPKQGGLFDSDVEGGSRI